MFIYYCNFVDIRLNIVFFIYRREREGLLHKFEYESLSDNGEVDNLESTLRALELQQAASYSGAYGGNYNLNRSKEECQRPIKRTLPKADLNRTIKSFSRSAAGLDKTRPEDLRPPEVLERTVEYLFNE